MGFNENEHQNLLRKAAHYKEVLENTRNYRELWKSTIKQQIMTALKTLADFIKIPVTLEERSEIMNLEAVAMNLGSEESGLSEPVSGIHRGLIKQNGSLIYQQLSNGKILVLIHYPFIEKYGAPQPPKTIAIYRPEELGEHYFLRHMETFISEMTSWEDYDDDLPEGNQRIGFKMNFENPPPEITEEQAG